MIVEFFLKCDRRERREERVEITREKKGVNLLKMIGTDA